MNELVTSLSGSLDSISSSSTISSDDRQIVHNFILSRLPQAGGRSLRQRRTTLNILENVATRMVMRGAYLLNVDPGGHKMGNCC